MIADGGKVVDGWCLVAGEARGRIRHLFVFGDAFFGNRGWWLVGKWLAWRDHGTFASRIASGRRAGWAMVSK
jgi:hypothetical protein